MRDHPEHGWLPAKGPYPAKLPATVIVSDGGERCGRVDLSGAGAAMAFEMLVRRSEHGGYPFRIRAWRPAP